CVLWLKVMMFHFHLKMFIFLHDYFKRFSDELIRVYQSNTDHIISPFLLFYLATFSSRKCSKRAYSTFSSNVSYFSSNRIRSPSNMRASSKYGIRGVR